MDLQRLFVAGQHDHFGWRRRPRLLQAWLSEVLLRISSLSRRSLLAILVLVRHEDEGFLRAHPLHGVHWRLVGLPVRLVNELVDVLERVRQVHALQIPSTLLLRLALRLL